MVTCFVQSSTEMIKIHQRLLYLKQVDNEIY